MSQSKRLNNHLTEVTAIETVTVQTRGLISILRLVFGFLLVAKVVFKKSVPWRTQKQQCYKNHQGGQIQRHEKYTPKVQTCAATPKPQQNTQSNIDGNIQWGDRGQKSLHGHVEITHGLILIRSYSTDASLTRLHELNKHLHDRLNKLLQTWQVRSCH